MEVYIPSTLKVSNRKIVYNLLNNVDSISRAEIARLTGISGATILKIIDYFIVNNIVQYVGKDESFTSVGRKPTSIKFNPDFAFVVSVLVEGKYASIGLVNMAGKVKECIKDIVIHDFIEFIESNLGELIVQLLNRERIKGEKIIGIGMALPGIVDNKQNIIKSAPLLMIKDNFELDFYIEKLSQKFNVPVYIENDVNACANGEFNINYKNKTQDMIYISIGTGLGAGIILDGKIRNGNSFFAGEIGYLCFDQYHIQQVNNAGWLETKINFQAFHDKYGVEVFNGKNDIKTHRAIFELGSYLATAINNMNAVLDIENIVIGGTVTEAFGTNIVEILVEEGKYKWLNCPKIQLSQSGNVGLVGMGLIVIENLLSVILQDE